MIKSRNNIKWPLVGNKHITDYLGRCVMSGQTAGTYVFDGPDNLGKTTVARYFAQILLCRERKNSQSPELPCRRCPSCSQFREKNDLHGDFHLIKKDKDKKNISIEQVRGLIKTLNMTSFLGGYKIGIIKHAENLSSEAANALLKTLEEPKKDVLIILITHNQGLLPQTVISRSKVLRFMPVKFDIIYENLIHGHGASRSQAKNFSRLSLGRPALAVKFFENREFLFDYQAKAEMFISFFTNDINYRLDAIQKIIPAKSNNQEQAISALRAIEIWQGLLRDWLLLEYGLDDLIQHQVLEQPLRQIKNKFSPPFLIRLNKTLEQARGFIFSNVNPGLALESIALSF